MWGAADGETAPYEPTALEAAAIAAAVAGVQWPEVRPLHRLVDPPPLIRDAAPEAVFEFRNEKNQIVLVQVRVEKDGEKSYRPLTFWTDQQWRHANRTGCCPCGVCPN